MTPTTPQSLPRRLVASAALIAVLVVAEAALDRGHHQVDLTAGRTLTLTTQTRQLLRRVHHRVRVTVVLARADPERIAASTLLSRYRRLNRHLTYRVLGPQSSPSEASRLGVDPSVGGIALVMGRRVERAETATEQDLTAAIARLLRPRPARVCSATGHGEIALDDSTTRGLSSAADLLRQNGFEPRAIDLLLHPEQLTTTACDALLLVDPTAPLGPAAPAIATYLANGGRAVVLADPDSRVDLSPVLRPYGLGLDRGLVIEADPRARFPDDPTRPVVLTFASPNPIVHRLPPVFFPTAERVTASEDTAHGLAAAELARTSATSWLDRDPQPVASFDPARDVHGPITVAAAADRSENLGTTVRRTRVVVVGDVDFALNAFVDQAGNGTLLVRALDWSTLQEDLVTVSTHLPRVRPLDLTQARLAYARLLLAGAVPALFLLGGAALWALRRTR